MKVRKEYTEEEEKLYEEYSKLKHTKSEVYKQYRDLEYWKHCIPIHESVFERNIGFDYDDIKSENVCELFYYDGYVYESVLKVNNKYYIKSGFDNIEYRNLYKGNGVYTNLLIEVKSDYDLYLYLSQKASLFEIAKDSIIFIHEEFTGEMFNDVYKEGERRANNYYYLNSGRYELKNFFNEKHDGMFDGCLSGGIPKYKFLKDIYKKYNEV